MDLKKELKLKYPVVQAPMAGAQDAKLAIVISNAGGLGSLPGALLSPDQLRLELSQIKEQVSGSYNVNFFCHQQPDREEQEQQLWISILLPYFRELEISVEEIKPTMGRLPFSYEVAEVLEEFNPPVVSFHFGLPEDRLIRKIRSLGSQIWSTATTLEEAIWLQTRGVDAVIAQGLEAGGHRGMFLSNELNTQLPRQTLLREISEKIKVPIVATGGVAEPCHLAEVLSSGAELAQVGTLFLLSSDSTTSPIHRSSIQLHHHTTELTNLFTGRPARGLVNRLMQELGPINHCVPKFPLATSALSPLRMKAEQQGKCDFSPLWAGIHYRKCKALPASRILIELAEKFC
ncbi:MAG: nitronate monooxygenase [Gammaproteobacteria bacterium]|nr:nitronate monooxygenase [Gammaproteobacteria bacterium]